jgi:hypothetical protein
VGGVDCGGGPRLPFSLLFNTTGLILARSLERALGLSVLMSWEHGGMVRLGSFRGLYVGGDERVEGSTEGE